MSDTNNAGTMQAVETSEDGYLSCPRCGPPGYGYLHHRIVNVYSRPNEDGHTRLTSVFHNGKLEISPHDNSRTNPSARRDGVAIRFCCESCGGGFSLELAQHKGQSQLVWRILTEAESKWLYNDWADVDNECEELRR